MSRFGVKYIVLIIVLLTQHGLMSAQKADANGLHELQEGMAISSFTHPPVLLNSEDEVKNHLQSGIHNLNKKNTSLKIINKTGSKHGMHYLFAQCYNHIAIYDAYVKINISLDGSIMSVFDNSINITGTTENIFPGDETIYNYVSAYRNIDSISIEKIYFRSSETILPACLVKINTGNMESVEAVIGNNGNILHRRDLNMYHSAFSDTLVAAYIFNPDPLTQAGVAYGSPYVDANDSDVAVLNAQRVIDSIAVDFSNDTFFLRNNRIAIKEFSSPVTTPAYCTTSANFFYTRSQPEFEDVNAYYHLNKFISYLGSIGQSSLVNYQLWVDAHALNGTDNSMFSPNFSPPRISYGEGGVDDAEDADVIIHEFGHAMMHSTAPNTNAGTQREAIDEGIGDYFAANYSKNIHTFGYDEIFSWDGHNEYWKGRTANSSKKYPTDLSGSKYADAEIWSSALLQISNSIGREISDNILIESSYSYAPHMSMADAAMLYIKTDSILHNGAHYSPICYHFNARGLVSSCYNTSGMQNNETGRAQIKNTYVFSQGNSPLLIENNSAGGIAISITDMNGKNVYSKKAFGTSVTEISPEHISQGAYLLSVKESNGAISTFKIIKTQ